jgi:Reverse transcriptase (RNA-dependent DNA polymerase)
MCHLQVAFPSANHHLLKLQQSDLDSSLFASTNHSTASITRLAFGICSSATISSGLSFKCLDSDPHIYYCAYHRAFIAVYVDDILIFGLDDDSCNQVYKSLAGQFNTQNLGYPTTFLGLNIIRDTDLSITIRQCPIHSIWCVCFQAQPFARALGKLICGFVVLRIDGQKFSVPRQRHHHDNR